MIVWTVFLFLPESPRCFVRQLKVFVLPLFTPDTYSSCTIVVHEISTFFKQKNIKKPHSEAKVAKT